MVGVGVGISSPVIMPSGVGVDVLEGRGDKVAAGLGEESNSGKVIALHAVSNITKSDAIPT